MRYEPNKDDQLVAEFRAAVKVLETQRRALIEAHASDAVIQHIGAIVRHLSGLPPSEVLRIALGSRHREIARDRKLRDAPKMASISLDEVVGYARDESTSRSVLEAIAVGRFDVPRGSLKSLGKQEQLREKLITLAENERAHETIAAVARNVRT